MNDDADLRLTWSGRLSLAPPHPGGEPADDRCWSRWHLYLDVFPQPALSKERTRQTRIEATATAEAIAGAPGPKTANRSLRPFRKSTGQQNAAVRARRARCWPTAGTLTGPTYQLRDPATQRLDKKCRPRARSRVQCLGRRRSRSTITSNRQPTGSRAGPKRRARQGGAESRHRRPQRARSARRSFPPRCRSATASLLADHQ